MINFEDKEKKKIFTQNLIQTIITIVVAIMFTYIIINFIPFSDMLDEFKVNFKKNNIEQIIKYYSFAIAIIVISIYTVVTFLMEFVVKFVYNIIKEKKEVNKQF